MRRSSKAPVRRSEPNISVHSSNGKLEVTRIEPPLVALAEDFEQQLGAGLRERHEAEFVDDQKVILCQLLLQAQQAFFIPVLHQFMNQGSGREEADGEPLLAGRQTETEGDMGLAGA